MFDSFASFPCIFLSLFLYILFLSGQSLSFSTYTRNKPLSTVSTHFDLKFIPHRTSRPRRYWKRHCFHFLLVSRLLQSQQPALRPTSSFLEPDLTPPLPHEFIHIPSVTIGPSFDTFEVNPLPFVYMLRTFHLISSHDTIPTCNHIHAMEYLQSTGPAYALTQYTQFFPIVLDSGIQKWFTTIPSIFNSWSPINFTRYGRRNCSMETH